jgi:hypothetical protein
MRALQLILYAVLAAVIGCSQKSTPPVESGPATKLQITGIPGFRLGEKLSPELKLMPDPDHVLNDVYFLNDVEGFTNMPPFFMLSAEVMEDRTIYNVTLTARPGAFDYETKKNLIEMLTSKYGVPRRMQDALGERFSFGDGNRTASLTIGEKGFSYLAYIDHALSDSDRIRRAELKKARLQKNLGDL